MTKLNSLSQIDFYSLLSGEDTVKQVFFDYMESLAELTEVIEGSGAPAIQAAKHRIYFDTGTNRYYRNVDGGTTWVALN